ncbi:hypothetical protein HK105_201289 [Polyrhizophydium stewartii]|uniref:Cytochrome P450 n=1 Tax=Polyrhizophydium stewartii TaxID=2732419 RepID=A0ABR4NHS9_9FUNG
MQSLNPTLPVVSLSFPRFVSGIDVTALGIIPRSFVQLQHNWAWKLHYKVFADLGRDVFIIVDSDAPTLRVADPDLIHEIVTRKTDFPKPIEFYGILDLFGRNVVTTEHAEWRRHRKVAAPQFSEKNNMFVHRETVRTVKDMFRAWDSTAAQSPAQSAETSALLAGNTGGVVIDVTNDMMKLALHVISSAGFGLKIDWVESESELKLPANHKMSFKTAIEEVINSLLLKLMLPKFVYSLPIKRIQHLKDCFEEFELYLREMIRSADAQTEANLLVSLAKAVKTEDPANSILTEQELVGNMFIFLFAGHETTADALNFSLALLAINQNAQQRLYDEVKTVIGDKDPEYRHIPELVYTLAVMNEALRMYPPVSEIPKISNGRQSVGGVNLIDRTRITLDVMALHHNPKYWGPDPQAFRPERWFASPECARSAKATADAVRANANARSTKEAPAMDGDLPQQAQPLYSYNRYAFIPFSEGARSCLGKRFSQIEFITALAMIVQNYSVHLPDGASPEQMLDTQMRITVQTAEHVKLVFRRRASSAHA